jgi:hypothetical protein
MKTGVDVGVKVVVKYRDHESTIVASSTSSLHFHHTFTIHYHTATWAPELLTKAIMDDLKLPIDPRTLEASVSSRRLRSIELDGTLAHEEP